MTHRQAFVAIMIVALALCGCAAPRHPATRPIQPATAPTAIAPGPILYHRTGGIDQTDDRVVIWPDGFVEVHGKIFGDGQGWLSKHSLNALWPMLQDWPTAAERPTSRTVIPDAYWITITFNGKSVTWLDLAPDLPPGFRRLYSTIEEIAGDITSSPQAPP